MLTKGTLNAAQQTNSIIQMIQANFDYAIRQKQLFNHQLPTDLNKYINNQVYQNMNAMVVQFDSFDIPGNGNMGEQKSEDVPNPGKDCLMPKGVETQSEIDNYTLGNESFFQRDKKIDQTKRVAKRNSLAGSMSRTNKTSSFSVGTAGKNKKKQTFFVPLQGQESLNEDDDPETLGLKKKKQIQIMQSQKIRIREQDRRKQFQSQKQTFTSQYQEKNYTFDFQGSFLQSELQVDKINYHAIKMKLSAIDKKNGSDARLRQSLQPIQVKVKPVKKLISSITNTDTQGIQMAVNIPVFDDDVSRSHFIGIPTDKGSCRLKDYKKYYGGKFSRLERQSQTLDLDKSNNIEQHEQLFKSKRYLKDQHSSLNQSIVSHRSIQKTYRKLALPKIKGKYSTLDRYNYK